MKSKIIVFFTLLALAAAAFAVLTLMGPQASIVSPARFVPASTGSVAVLEGFARLGKDLERLSGNRAVAEFLALAGKPSASQLLDEAARQLGVDVRSGESLKSAGIDQRRSAYLLVHDPESAPVAAIPAESFPEIQKWLDGRMLALKGLSPMKACPVALGDAVPAPATSVCYSASPESAAPQVISVQAGGYLYLAQGGKASDALKMAFATPADASMESDQGFLAGVQALGHPTVHGYSRLPAVRVSAGVDLARGVSLRGHLVARPPEEISTGSMSGDFLHSEALLAFTELTKLSAFQPTPPDIATRLDPEAALIAQSGISPVETARFLKALFPEQVRKLDMLLAPVGLSLEGVADKFMPGAAISLSLAPGANLMALTSLSRLKSTSAFDIVHMEFLAKVKGEASVRNLLDAAAAAASRLGLTVQRFSQDGTFIEEGAQDGLISVVKGLATALGIAAGQAGADDADGGVQAPPDPRRTTGRWVCAFRRGTGFTIELKDGTLLVAGGGKQVYDALAGRAPSGAFVRGLGDAGAVASLDFGTLSSSIQAIPESSFGIGGGVIKATLDRWLKAFDGVRSVKLTAAGGGGAMDIGASLFLDDGAPAAGAQP